MFVLIVSYKPSYALALLCWRFGTGVLMEKALMANWWTLMKIIIFKPPPQSGGFTHWHCPLFAYASYANCLFVCLRDGQWPEWSSSTMVLAAISSHSAPGPPRPQVSQMLPPREKLHSQLPCEIYASSRGWLMASINTPHLLNDAVLFLLIMTVSLGDCDDFECCHGSAVYDCIDSIDRKRTRKRSRYICLVFCCHSVTRWQITLSGLQMLSYWHVSSL